MEREVFKVNKFSNRPAPTCHFNWEFKFSSCSYILVFLLIFTGTLERFVLTHILLIQIFLLLTFWCPMRKKCNSKHSHTLLTAVTNFIQY